MQHIEIFFNNIFKLSFKQIAVAFFILFIFIIIEKFILGKILLYIGKLTSRTNSKIDDNIVHAITRPIKFLFIGVGIYFSLKSINIDIMPSDMLSSSKYLKIIIVVTISMFLYNLTLENSIFYISGTGKVGEKKVVFPFVAIVIRVIIIIIAVISIAHEIGLTGFLTGLGVSGIVVAFAAQDTCSNLFGGMMIALDKSFSLGDWIKANDIEGVVEEITFRSTRIRTFCKSLVTVPNSKLTNNNIINYSKRDRWRITYKLSIDLNTKAKDLEKIIEGIETIIKSKEEVQKDLVIVKFSEITTGGYVILVYFYIDMVSFLRYEEIKEDMNMAILSLMEHYGVNFSENIISGS